MTRVRIELQNGKSITAKVNDRNYSKLSGEIKDLTFLQKIKLLFQR